MGEGHTEPHDTDRTATGQPTEPRATVGEAAGILGLTAEAVRSRIKRGTLKSTKEGRTVYVLLEGAPEQTDANTKKGADWTDPGPKSDRTAPERDRTNAQTAPEHDQADDRAELVDVLRDQVGYLREQLGEEREARRRADMLLARLAEANASMAGEIRELTAPDRPPDEPETGAEAPEDASSPRPDTTGAQTATQEPEETARRPWWVRIFGG